MKGEVGVVGVPPATVRGLLWGVLLRGVLLLLLPLPPVVLVVAVVVVVLPLSRLRLCLRTTVAGEGNRADGGVQGGGPGGVTLLALLGRPIMVVSML